MTETACLELARYISYTSSALDKSDDTLCTEIFHIEKLLRTLNLGIAARVEIGTEFKNKQYLAYARQGGIWGILIDDGGDIKFFRNHRRDMRILATPFIAPLIDELGKQIMIMINEMEAARSKVILYLEAINAVHESIKLSVTERV